MIAFVRGPIIDVGEGWVLVDVGGLGYMIHVPALHPEQIGKVGEQIQLRTHLDVREDALDLYGFFEGNQLEVFKALITVPRVGSKLAVKILIHLSPGEIVDAVLAKAPEPFIAVPGVGSGLAERILMDLKRKVKKLQFSGSPGRGLKTVSSVKEQAREALKALGYRGEEIRAAIEWVEQSGSAEPTLDVFVREALGFFQKGK